jgi:GNAT superfamily N-acetyltransferase
VSRKVVPLEAEALEQVPERCRVCLFWELGWVRPAADLRSDDLVGDPLVQKQAWCTAQVLDGVPPGRAVLVDGVMAGYALFGRPDVFAPRSGVVPAPSEDSLLLATAWVDPTYRDEGIGRLLVQAALKEAIRLDLRAVEAYGDRRHREADCVMPATWLLHEGFEIETEHPRYPLMRIDTRRTVRWADAIEHAVEEVLDMIPKRVTVPVPDAGGPLPEPQRMAPTHDRR